MRSYVDQNRVLAGGIAREKSTPDYIAYADWTAKIVREELHKAGWRLADILNRALISSSATASGYEDQ